VIKSVFRSGQVSQVRFAKLYSARKGVVVSTHTRLTLTLTLTLTVSTSVHVRPCPRPPSLGVGLIP
jgi:hypothetical protein